MITEKELPMDLQFTRTRSIIKQLYAGDRILLKDGCKIVMGEDITIGYLLWDSKGNESMTGGVGLTFKQLNTILNENDIGLRIKINTKR